MAQAFTKMQALGNDFIVLYMPQAFSLSPEKRRLMADRRFGIGCDQILVIQPLDSAASPDSDSADFKLSIYNADGSEANQCGNGIRCIIKFIYARALCDKAYIVLQLPQCSITAYLIDADQVAVNMGSPMWAPACIPMHGVVAQTQYDLSAYLGVPCKACVLSVGNPHAVVMGVFDEAEQVRLGQALNCNPCFPEGVNVSFMQVHAPSAIGLQVFERGVGLTFACGSGACAAVAAGRMLGLLDETVTVTQRGGQLTVKQDALSGEITLIGPAYWVFDGVYLD